MREFFASSPGLRWGCIIGLVCLVSFALGLGRAEAQVAPYQLNMSWTLPTQGCTVDVVPCDGIALPATGADALAGVEVFVSSSPIADTFSGDATLVLGPGVTSGSFVIPAQNQTRLYARLKAFSNRGLRSPMSAQVDTLVEFPIVPGVPTNVTLTIVSAP